MEPRNEAIRPALFDYIDAAEAKADLPSLAASLREEASRARSLGDWLDPLF